MSDFYIVSRKKVNTYTSTSDPSVVQVAAREVATPERLRPETEKYKLLMRNVALRKKLQQEGVDKEEIQRIMEIAKETTEEKTFIDKIKEAAGRITLSPFLIEEYSEHRATWAPRAVLGFFDTPTKPVRLILQKFGIEDPIEKVRKKLDEIDEQYRTKEKQIIAVEDFESFRYLDAKENAIKRFIREYRREPRSKEDWKVVNEYIEQELNSTLDKISDYIFSVGARISLKNTKYDDSPYIREKIREKVLQAVEIQKIEDKLYDVSKTGIGLYTDLNETIETAKKRAETEEKLSEGMKKAVVAEGAVAVALGAGLLATKWLGLSSLFGNGGAEAVDMSAEQTVKLVPAPQPQPQQTQAQQTQLIGEQERVEIEKMKNRVSKIEIEIEKIRPTREVRETLYKLKKLIRMFRRLIMKKKITKDDYFQIKTVYGEIINLYSKLKREVTKEKVESFSLFANTEPITLYSNKRDLISLF